MRLQNVVVLLPLLLVFTVADSQAAGEEFRPLFNGTDLDGWVLVNTPASTWTVRDNMLVCSGKPIGEIRTARMYQNFILELEWRHMRPKGNAGVFVWADDITARGVPFHRSIEVQVLENAYGNKPTHTTHGDIFPIHGATMTPLNGRGGSRAFPTEQRSKPSPQWNHYRITCRDGEISLAVNGKVVTRGKNCSPRKGYLCLESEGGIVHYRNLRIHELPETPIDPQDVTTADRGFRSLYSGLDLSGWQGAEEALKSWHARDWVLTYDGKASDGDPSIATTESFGEFGFILDVRLKEKSSFPEIRLRGSEKAAITFDSHDPLASKLFAPPGRWNRLEGTVRGDRVTITLNGRALFRDKQLSGLPAKGPLIISPRGPVDLANIYVRNLSGAAE